ncbi:MAG: hypothetical protein QNJ44_22535 [Rhodobacter sp.]|nr:hypothetical protein [Rhodobacter sp.]
MSPLFHIASLWSVQETRWGENDCMLVLADWVHAQGHPDPAAEVRGTYDRAQSRQAVEFLRAPVETAARYFEGVAGLTRTEAPGPGDIAVLLVPQPGGMRPIGALNLGPVWVAKAERFGVVQFAGPQVLGAWDVGYA